MVIYFLKCNQLSPICIIIELYQYIIGFTETCSDEENAYFWIILDFPHGESTHMFQFKSKGNWHVVLKHMGNIRIACRTVETILRKVMYEIQRMLFNSMI